jgi:hypothetical protein
MSEDQQRTISTETKSSNCLGYIMINPFIDHILKFECNSIWCKALCNDDRETLATEAADSWYRLWLWHDIDYHDDDRWNKEKNEVLYSGLDMEAAYHAGWKGSLEKNAEIYDLESKVRS